MTVNRVSVNVSKLQRSSRVSVDIDKFIQTEQDLAEFDQCPFGGGCGVSSHNSLLCFDECEHLCPLDIGDRSGKRNSVRGIHCRCQRDIFSWINSLGQLFCLLPDERGIHHRQGLCRHCRTDSFAHALCRLGSIKHRHQGDEFAPLDSQVNTATGGVFENTGAKHAGIEIPADGEQRIPD